jgi:hypothetical protein
VKVSEELVVLEAFAQKVTSSPTYAGFGEALNDDIDAKRDEAGNSVPGHS